MKKISICLVVMLVMSMIAGTMVSANDVKKSNFENPFENELSQTHTVLGEFGTATWCGYCRYAHGALKALFVGGWHDFYYISLVDDMNVNAEERIDEYGISGYPTVWWDGDYTSNVGAGSIPSAMAAYNSSIISCGNRNVDDIDVDISVVWQGSATMSITVTVDNNEASSYSGYLRCYVTEAESSLNWKDTGGVLYTFAFLDYAFEQSISISAGGTWSDTVTWDGADYNNGYGTDFDMITEDNTYIIASVYASQFGYVDETAGVLVGGNSAPNEPSAPDPEDGATDVSVNPTLSWEGGDPQWFDHVTYDVYFEANDPTPDVLVSEDQNETTYEPDTLEFDTTYYWKIDAEDNNGATASGPVWSFTTRGNQAPNAPSDPDPADGETDIAIDKILGWTGGDPDGDDVTYDVYFGDSSPPPKVKSNQSGETYNPPGTLDFETNYYWRIVAWDEFGYSSEGSEWSFTTEENVPPNEPSDPDPADGATDVSIYATIWWTGGDQNSGDKVKYDIYFGTTSPPPKVESNQTAEAYQPDTMELATTYYWQIVAWDSGELTTSGDIWQFTTELEPNDPPNKPEIQGPPAGNFNEEYDYTFSATDPENHDVFLWIEWGDGDIVEWAGPYSSGEDFTLSHTWTEKGTYKLKVKAKDIKEAESEWAELEVMMPKNKGINFNFPLLNWLFEHFPNVFPIFRQLFGL
jgi:hypothetical protein